jgi:hypothetical protein
MEGKSQFVIGKKKVIKSNLEHKKEPWLPARKLQDITVQ